MTDLIKSDEGQTTLARMAPEQRKGELSKALSTHYMMSQAEFLSTVKRTCFPNNGENVTNEQLAAFLIVANEYDLNPFVKQLYAFSGKGGGITPMIPIDGWVSLINRNHNFNGATFEDVFKDDKIFSTTVTMHQKDWEHPIIVTEYYSECYRKTDPWDNMPARMLRHKAYIQAGRLAFGISGVYDPDEAKDIEKAEIIEYQDVETEQGITDATEAIDDTEPVTEDPPADESQPEEEQADANDTGAGPTSHDSVTGNDEDEAPY